MSTSDPTITIEHGAIEHEGGGWLPWMVNNGRGGERMRTGARFGLGLDEALQLACDLAAEEAARYIGDWSVTVTARGEISR